MTSFAIIVSEQEILSETHKMKLVDRRNKWKWKSNFVSTVAKRKNLIIKMIITKGFGKPMKMLTIWLQKLISPNFEIWKNHETMWASRRTTFSEGT